MLHSLPVNFVRSALHCCDWRRRAAIGLIAYCSLAAAGVTSQALAPQKATAQQKVTAQQEAAIATSNQKATASNVRPQLQIFNGSRHDLQVFWLPQPEQRELNQTIAPGQHKLISTTIGHRFVMVGKTAAGDPHQAEVESKVAVQAVRFDPENAAGIPAFYTQVTDIHGFPIVASAGVSPFAVAEAKYLVSQMLAQRPDILQAMTDSGARLCIMAHNEFTTDLPEFVWLGKSPMKDFPLLPGKDYWDARARGTGGSATDPFCSCAEENLLAYPGDPYWQECILIHEFAHAIHLRGMSNIDPGFDRRLQEAYRQAMNEGLWKGKYASVNHHEYFAEGVQSWFDNNRENDLEHNHVNTRQELLTYDPRLAELCREVFGDTALKYTKPETRLVEHLAGFDPSQSPRFTWPKRLESAQIEIRRGAEQRAKQ